MRVVSTSSLPIDLVGQVTQALPDAEVFVPPSGHVGLDGIAQHLEQTDALVCLLLDRIDAAAFDRMPNVRVVANCAVGVDNVDIREATRRKIAVTNTPDVLTEATAELAFTLMLAAARRIGEGERLVRSGQWTGWALDQLLGVQLQGKTLGVVGYGRIGQALARRATGFGMRVIYTGANPGPERMFEVPIDELFATADVVSIHTPLTAQTKHLVDAARLARMKPTAILVNTARGGVVDENALIEALTAGRIFAAALDVYVNEPAIDPRLLTCPRLVLAPHIGSATTETRTAMAQLCADAVIAILSGARPTNLVNPEVLE